ncbi:MAG: hypothetical protein MUD09_09310, partial [Desulfobacterales bacterium]|nr:hypothetical protein [Desulfobacterales bacterium]
MKQIEMDTYPGIAGKYLSPKTDTKFKQDKMADLFSDLDEFPDITRMHIEKTLINKFPDLLLGDDFFEYASKQIESWDH